MPDHFGMLKKGEDVLITGASGFIGRYLVSMLPAATPLSMRTDPATWDAALRGKNCVVHLAARVHQVNDIVSDPLALYRQTNVVSSVALAERAAAAGVRRFVFVSSVKVHGESTQPGHPFTELDFPSPQDPYGISKWEAEKGLHQVGARTGMEIVIIRPPLVYGPGAKANLAALMQVIRLGLPMPVASIKNRRSMVGLDNLVDFIACCATHPLAANQTFLVSDRHDVSTPDLVRTMAEVANLPVRQWRVPVSLLSLLGKLTGKAEKLNRLTGNLQVDISKAQSLLKWQPPLSFEAGVRAAMAIENVR